MLQSSAFALLGLVLGCQPVVHLGRGGERERNRVSPILEQATILVLLAGGLELAQFITGRAPRLIDFVMNSAAVLIGLLIAAVQQILDGQFSRALFVFRPSGRASSAGKSRRRTTSSTGPRVERVPLSGDAFPYASRSIFILGAPRSGTTWLAKVLDSHPAVLYRHEPDIIHRNPTIPFLCEAEDASRLAPIAKRWLTELTHCRVLKSAGSLPVFYKSYHTRLQTLLRILLICLLKGLAVIPGCRRWAEAIRIPDFSDLDVDCVGRIVIKSVSCMGRVNVLARAAADSRFILIIRHPCGQVSSMLRGVRAGKFEDRIPILTLAETPQARRRGLTMEKLRDLPFVAQLAWSWVIENEMALEALDAEAVQKMIVRYFDLAVDPEGMARRMLAFCGLEVEEQVIDFIRESSRADGTEGYYELRRVPRDAAQRWRKDLSPDEIDTIMQIVGQSRPGRLFADAIIGA
ncbi:MAG TPA: sulfotransferase [Stellaceae bacterium]|nr:sulfotransferase [Stellaceae bacterium]